MLGKLVLMSALSFNQPAMNPEKIELTAPIKTWDEGIPLGNGHLGALLWGEGRTLRISLDTGRLWDERLPEMLKRPDWTYAKMRELHAKGDWKTMHEYFDIPYDTIAYPTKLPAGRIELTLPEGWESKQFSLNMPTGVGSVELGHGQVNAIAKATEKVILIELPTNFQPKLMRPESLAKLGYGAAEFGKESELEWFHQKGAEGFEWVVAYGTRRQGDKTLLAATIIDNHEAKRPVEEAKRRLNRALGTAFQDHLKPHTEWWSKLWSTSSVQVPHERIQWQYNLAKYYYGSASRTNGKPIPLQGLWTADAGTLPPWKGDYHNDLNTQTTYLAYHTAGLNEAGTCWLDYNWDRLPSYRQFAQDFYQTKGAAIPGVMTLDGKPMGGWGQYSLSPTNGAWVAQSFYRHWLFTRDPWFLRERAYPFCTEIAISLRELLVKDEDGTLRLPLSSSPEIHDNSPKSWLKPNSNYDNALLLLIFRACKEMALSLGKSGEAADWEKLEESLPEFIQDESGALMFAEGEPMAESHRHHSHSMAIHPLEIITPDTRTGIRTVNKTLDATLKHGTRAWVGYSFSWMSCILARAGRAEESLKMLDDYSRAFVLRNGFHANGDQIGAGLSGFTYRPVTLEGNFLAMEAVHDMLLQSWGGTVRVFPAVSEKWADASFEKLRAEGGFIVSATRVKGETKTITIRATVDSPLRLLRNFGDSDIQGDVQLRMDGDSLVAEMKKGQEFTLTVR